MVKMEFQSFDSNMCLQRGERTWLTSITEGVNHSSLKAVNEGGEGTTVVESSIPIPWERTISTWPVYSGALRSEKCFSSLTFSLNQDGMLLSTRTARPKRFIGTELATFSCLEGGVPCGACFDLLTSSMLPRMRLSFSAINLHSDCCKHVPVNESAVIISFLSRSCSALWKRTFK